MCEDLYDSRPPLSDEWRKARKEHQCFACSEKIRPGDRYHYVAQPDDDLGFFTVKHCARCWALGQAIIDAGGETWQYDLNCGVSWQEAFGEDPPDDVARLVFLTPDEAQKDLTR